MTENVGIEIIEILAAKLERDLLATYGPLLFGSDLHKALGYCSGDAFRQAVCRKTLPVSIFSIESRRGRFALSHDVALWLARQRYSAENKNRR